VTKYTTIIPDIEFWQGMIPCQAACPVHTDAGRYVQLIAEGKYKESYFVARSPNPFASVCGRICAAPCETSCRRGRIDAPVTIRALKRFVTEKYGVESMEPDTQDELRVDGGGDVGNKWRWHLPVLQQSRANVARGQKVAVIGAGPAGISAAHDLALMGYRVTVFEASARAGGMMYHGIPEFRLARAIIDKEIQKTVDLGVEIKLNTPLNETFGVKELKRAGFEAIFMSVGVQKGRDMKIEGSDLDGVIKAIDYLININNGYRVNLGRRVLVIGGGFVAFDAARMALRAAAQQTEEETGHDVKTALDAARAAIRAGAVEVYMASLESFEEMPVMRTTQGREEFEESKREGVRFLTQRGAKRFIGENGRLKAVEFMGVKRTYDDDGRFNPVYDVEFSEILEADSIILAIGQQADLSFLTADDRVELTPQGTIKVDPQTLATSAPGLFAGGDVAFGPRNLIEAVANGKRAALSIDDYLRGAKSELAVNLRIEKLPTRSYRRAEDYEKCEREAPPTISLDRRTGISEVETGFTEEQAKRQAERCLYCHIQTIYDAEKCVLCNRCVDICPEYCLKLVPLEQLDLDQQLKDQVIANEGISFTGPLSAMLKDDEKCIRCGLCAIRCPTDAMTMEVFYYEEQEVRA
jgi:formate dehydrogenase (NADP+) beta subunit